MADRKSSLTAAQARLVETMQKLNYGQIRDLTIRGGDPVFDPLPRITRVIRIGGENSPRPELAKKDFVLRHEIIEFFTHLERMGDGVVRHVEVQRGLPFKVRIEEVLA